MRWSLLALPFAVLLVLAPAKVALAQDGPGVVYSYEKVQLGNTAQWVLVPQPLPGTVTDDLESNLRAAFLALRKAKPPTYGRSNLVVEPDQLKKGRVFVEIDAEKFKYALIIEAEVMETFSTLGVKEVVFRGETEETLKPGDLPFAAFVPVIPTWRALPPARLDSGYVRLGEGSLVPAATFAKELANKEQRVVDAVYAELSTGAPLSRVGVLERLGTLGLPGWEDAAAARLADADASVRLAAVAALKGTKSKSALEALVATVDKDTAPEVQAAAAGALSASGDPTFAAYGIYYAMRGSDPAAAVAALDELVKQGSSVKVDEVVKALAHADARVGLRAATALRQLEQPRELLKAIANAALALPVRIRAGEELAQSKEKDEAFAGLSFVAANAEPPTSVEAIGRLTSFKDPEPVKALEAALQSPHSEARIAAAAALAELKEDGSAAAIIAASRTFPDDAEALEDLVVLLFTRASTLSDMEDRLKKERDPMLRRTLFRAVASKAREAGRFKAIRDKLVEGIEDKEEVARGGAILGLSEEPDEENLTLIASKASDDSPLVRIDVALALRHYPAGQATDVLMALAADSETSVAVAGIRSLGARVEKAVLRDLIKMGKHQDPAVRGALLSATAKMVDPDNRADVTAFISNALFDDVRNVKLMAIQQLGALADEQAIGSLALLVQDPDKGFQHATFAALGKSKNPEAVALIGQGISAPDVPTRLAAVAALGTHAGPEAVATLEALRTTETDPEVKAAVEAALEKLP